jgi:hypothetical protein
VSFAAWTGLGRAKARSAVAAVAESDLDIDGKPYAAIGWEPDPEPAEAVVRLPAFDA